MVLGGKKNTVELKAVTAAEKSMFIKRCRSVAGDLRPSGGGHSAGFVIKQEEKLASPRQRKSLSRKSGKL